MLETILTTLYSKAGIFTNSIVVADERTLEVFQYGGVTEHLICSLECLSIFNYEDDIKIKLKKLSWLCSPRPVQIVFLYSTLEERDICESLQEKHDIKKATFAATSGECKRGDQSLSLPFAALNRDIFFTPLPKNNLDPPLFSFDARSLPQNEVLEDLFHRYVPQRTLQGLFHASESLAAVVANLDLNVTGIYCCGTSSKVLGKMTEKSIKIPSTPSTAKAAILIVDKLLDVGTSLILGQKNKLKDLLLTSQKKGGGGIEPVTVEKENLTDIMQLKAESIKLLSSMKDVKVSMLMAKAITSTERLIELAHTVSSKNPKLQRQSSTSHNFLRTLQMLVTTPSLQKKFNNTLLDRRDGNSQNEITQDNIDTISEMRVTLKNMKASLQLKSVRCVESGNLHLSNAITNMLIIASETSLAIDDTVSTMLQEYEFVLAMVVENCITSVTKSEMSIELGNHLTSQLYENGQPSTDMIRVFVNTLMFQIKRLFGCRSEQQILSQQLLNPTKNGFLKDLVDIAIREPGLLLTDAIRLQPSEGPSQAQLSGWLGGISSALLGEAATDEKYDTIIVYSLGGITPSEALHLTQQQSTTRVVVGGTDLLTPSSLLDAIFASE